MRRLALVVLLLAAAHGRAQAETGPGDQAVRPGAPSSLQYPLPQAEPEFTSPGEPFELYDLRYGFSDTFSTTHSFAARVRVGHLGLAGVELEGERRLLTLETHRLFVSTGGAEGAYDFFGSYRAPWFLLSGFAERRPGRERAWLLGPTLAVRVARGLDVVGRTSGDTGERAGRFLRAWSVGFLWQRGARLELAGEYARAWEATGGRHENARQAGSLGVLAQVGVAELSAGGSIEEVRGLFSYRQVEGEVEARATVGPRLRLDGGAWARSEDLVGEIAQTYLGAVTWFARPFRLPRSGRAAETSVALARHAVARGLFERRAFDPDQIRAQRERLSLSPWREELSGEMRALYEAQVGERAVPSLGFEIEARRDVLSRLRSRTLRATVGVAWPPTWPWLGREDAVPFLRLDVERERVLSGPGYESIRYALGLTLSFNREMDLLFRWSREEPTPLDLIRGVGERRTVELSYVYAFGR